MNIKGEYSVQYNIYTMFDVYEVTITNHNLITNDGYEFFLRKWYQEELYPFELGYYHEGRFYETKNVDDTYDNDLSDSENGGYSKVTNYIDKDTYRQYRYDGEKFVSFYEKLTTICIGRTNYIDEDTTKPTPYDTDLYDTISSVEYDVEDFIRGNTELILICEFENTELNGTTEIGIKTNHGRLVSHDIHPPYNLPFGTTLTLKYSFKLKD